MILRVGDVTLAGHALDLGRALEADSDAPDPERVDPATVATAIRTGSATTGEGTTVEVLACRPGPLHERVGCIEPSLSIRPRTALATAARSRGWTTPVDEALAAARERLAAHHVDADPPATDAHRRELADVTAEVDRLRERAAAARGRLQAGQGGQGGQADQGGQGGQADQGDGDGRGPGSAGKQVPLESAIRELSEAETAIAAARENHRAAREAARATRDRLQKRLRLEDEVGNLEREARAHLVSRARQVFETALAAVPDVRRPTDPFAADPDAMALAVARIGHVSAPVVVATDRFDSAAAAARWLAAPVVRL